MVPQSKAENITFMSNSNTPLQTKIANNTQQDKRPFELDFLDSL